jgi:hypothetical protein
MILTAGTIIIKTFFRTVAWRATSLAFANLFTITQRWAGVSYVKNWTKLKAPPNNNAA